MLGIVLAQLPLSLQLAFRLRGGTFKENQSLQGSEQDRVMIPRDLLVVGTCVGINRPIPSQIMDSLAKVSLSCVEEPSRSTSLDWRKPTTSFEKSFGVRARLEEQNDQ